jgi:hypothetical protein
VSAFRDSALKRRRTYRRFETLTRPHIGVPLVDERVCRPVRSGSLEQSAGCSAASKLSPDPPSCFRGERSLGRGPLTPPRVSQPVSRQRQRVQRAQYVAESPPNCGTHRGEADPRADTRTPRRDEEAECVSSEEEHAVDERPFFRLDKVVVAVVVCVVKQWVER